MNIVKTVASALVLILCAATALGQECETQVIDDAADEPGDRFGDSVAIAMPWMIVGARDDSIPDFEHAGTAFIFKHVNGEWTQFGDRLIDPDPVVPGTANARFGHSVAIWQDPGDENLALAAVGAPKHSGAAGRVFIYMWDGTEWGHIFTVDDSQNVLDGVDGRPLLESGDELGTGVAITQTTGGRIWIFCGADEDDRLTAEDPMGNDLDDPMEPIGTNDDAGCVYIFEYVMGNVFLHEFDPEATPASRRYRVRESAPQAAARFAWSLAASGDWVVVSAPLRTVNSNGNKSKAGHLTVLRWDPEGGPEEDGAWEHHGDPLPGTDVTTNRSLGAAVAIAQSVIVAGTRNNRAYLWELVNGTWTQRALIQPTLLDGTTPIGRPGDRFGEWGVAVSKYDDTLYLVAVGAPGDDDHGVNSGSVFTYSYNAQTPATTLIGTLRRPAGVDGNPLSGWGSCDAFGWRVAASGTMVVAGGPQDQNLGGSGSTGLASQHPGAVHVFEDVPGNCDEEPEGMRGANITSARSRNFASPTPTWCTQDGWCALGSQEIEKIQHEVKDFFEINDVGQGVELEVTFALPTSGVDRLVIGVRCTVLHPGESPILYDATLSVYNVDEVEWQVMGDPLGTSPVLEARSADPPAGQNQPVQLSLSAVIGAGSEGEPGDYINGSNQVRVRLVTACSPEDEGCTTYTLEVDQVLVEYRVAAE